MPYFSVIIPAYNREKLICRTIESVLGQKFEDWELIVVDDGSTDDTGKAVKSFADERIRYIYQKNAERGAARNNGVKNAFGKYVFFLDSDDLLYPDHLQIAFNNLSKLGEPEFFHIRYEEISGVHKKTPPPLDRSCIHSLVYRQNRFACQFFLRQDVAEKFPFSENRELKIGEDWGVILKIAVRFPLHFTNQVAAAIVQHDERSMKTAPPEVILRSRDILIEDLSKDEAFADKNFILNNVFTELTSLAALSAALYKQKKTALKLILTALRSDFKITFSRRFLAVIKHLLYG
jgi:glycosyltransferase involved in cell wall biosynthesis